MDSLSTLRRDLLNGLKNKKHDAQGEAMAGKTAGGVRFSLIFLFLFVSRQKEKKEETIKFMTSMYSLSYTAAIAFHYYFLKAVFFILHLYHQ